MKKLPFYVESKYQTHLVAVTHWGEVGRNVIPPSEVTLAIVVGCVR